MCPFSNFYIFENGCIHIDMYYDYILMQHNTAIVDEVISFQHTSISLFGLYSSGSGDLVIFILLRSGSLILEMS